MHTHNHSSSTRIGDVIHHVTHVLPSQGPIKVFVHHNTLHAFEDHPFDSGVRLGLEAYGCEPYLSEHRYRQEFEAGRIRTADLESVLLHDLSDEADRLVASFGTRFALQLAMLRFPIRMYSDREIQWIVSETDYLTRFRREVDPPIIRAMVDNVRKVLQKDPSQWAAKLPHEADRETGKGLDRYRLNESGSWPDEVWQAYTLKCLWQLCVRGVRTANEIAIDGATESLECCRYRDWLLETTDVDTDRWVHDVLIRYTAAFLDQGFAPWELPNRDQGFLSCFIDLYRQSAILPQWLRNLPKQLEVLEQGRHDVEAMIERLLTDMCIPEELWEAHISASLLALRGWAGMIWQLETNAPWTPRQAAQGTLTEFLAVRLILDQQATLHCARTQLRMNSFSDLAREKTCNCPVTNRESLSSRALTIFQLAQARGWAPTQLVDLTACEWKQLVTEVTNFDSLHRRRIFHAAYERHYRTEALDAVAVHSTRIREATVPLKKPPKFQVVTCIDDREESFRRHLEEVEPYCETFGAAGFYAVVMYYQGAAEAHFRPLCPINVVPKHYVREEPIFSAADENERRSHRRKLLGSVTHQVHSGSRTLVGGLITGILGSFATFPLVARVMAPRITSQIRDVLGGFVSPPPTELHLERDALEPGKDFDALGYSVDEMGAIVVRILQDIGLTDNFAPVVLFLGHGSSSLNNPHESAYNCGACSGGRGGPNARAFAFMANDSRVRQVVAKSGIEIPDDVRFLGGYHNTCNDRVEYFDLDHLPRSHRNLFRNMEAQIQAARCRNALERCRRFESAPVGLTPEEALNHVEERSEDLSQARPEYNHATNALCFVGQREWSRGLFLDRRAFLASYDPSIDTPDGKIVERILQAAIPVCGGISLEYYFSTVDPEGYGCGSKLPHNITSLIGVMTGAASDLRPGLSQQMIEIHEPMRILFVVQTTAEIMQRIIKANAPIQSLVENEWVQLAILDSQTSSIQLYEKGKFVPYRMDRDDLPRVEGSEVWFRGHGEHLGFATIEASLQFAKGGLL
ncbi:MAG: DUF2309 domain-containing protein [Planctomycetales bacterium]|nr:DUF2309 domain-containing protein [Planctomycetales bacterium]